MVLLIVRRIFAQPTALMTMFLVGSQAKPAPCHTMPKIMTSSTYTGRSVPSTVRHSSSASGPAFVHSVRLCAWHSGMLHVYAPANGAGKPQQLPLQRLSCGKTNARAKHFSATHSLVPASLLPLRSDGTRSPDGALSSWSQTSQAPDHWSLPLCLWHRLRRNLTSVLP